MPPSASRTCLRCGYDLSGLPRIGRCPECGERFNADSGLGVTNPKVEAMQRNDRITRRLRTLGLAGAAVVVVIAGGLVNTPNGRSFWAGLFFAAILALGALTSWVYEKD